MFVYFADSKEIDVPMINPKDSQKPFFIIFLGICDIQVIKIVLLFYCHGH